MPNEGTENQIIPVIDFKTASKIFTNQPVSGVELSSEFLSVQKQITQVYDTIIRFLTGQYKRESPFPTTEDVFKELQIYKRTINDRMPMPSSGELDKLLLILATEKVPFISIVKGLSLDVSGALQVQTYYIAPLENEPDKVSEVWATVLHNSLVAIKELFRNKKAVATEKSNSIEDRLDVSLVKMFLKNPASMEKRLRRANEEIKRRIYIPLLQKLYNEKFILILNTKDLPGTWNKDFIYLNIPELITKRLVFLTNQVEQDVTAPFINQDFAVDLKAKLQRKEITDPQYYASLARHILQNGSDALPPAIKDIAGETVKLAGFADEYEKFRIREKEKDEVVNVLQLIKKHNNLFQAKKNGKYTIPEKYIKMILEGKIPSVLATTVPYEEIGKEARPELYEAIFFLMKDRQATARAIDMACEIFHKNADLYFLRVLDTMFQKKDEDQKLYLAPHYENKLKEALFEGLKKYLPWYKKFMVIFFGSGVGEDTLATIRQELFAEDKRILYKTRQKFDGNLLDSAKSQIKERVEKRTKGNSEGVDITRKSLSEDDAPVLQTMIDFLIASWEKGVYPVSSELIRAAGDKKDSAKRIMGYVEVGAASVKAIARIPIPNHEPIYGPRDYMVEHKAELLASFESKGRLSDEHAVGDQTLVLKNENKKGALYRSIAAYIKKL